MRQSFPWLCGNSQRSFFRGLSALAAAAGRVGFLPWQPGTKRLRLLRINEINARGRSSEGLPLNPPPNYQPNKQEHRD